MPQPMSYGACSYIGNPLITLHRFSKGIPFVYSLAGARLSTTSLPRRRTTGSTAAVHTDYRHSTVGALGDL